MSHKERIKTIQNGFSLPRNYYKYTQNGNSYSENNKHKSQRGRIHSEDNESYHQPQSPVYQNMQSDEIKNKNKTLECKQKSIERQTSNNNERYSESHNNNTRTKEYRPGNKSLPSIYKSQSLNALVANEPTKSLGKSSMHQEYHDKLVQEQITGIYYGKAKRPCQIATIMLIIFGLCFITGLTLICLTYIYKNINFSLDKGEMIGPVIMAGSFIFLGVALKFLFDAYRIARAERRHIAYRAYDRHYVGLKDGQKLTPKQKERLTSGTVTEAGVSRLPNRKSGPLNTMGRSSQQIYGKVYGDSEL